MQLQSQTAQRELVPRGRGNEADVAELAFVSLIIFLNYQWHYK